MLIRPVRYLLLSVVVAFSCGVAGSVRSQPKDDFIALTQEFGKLFQAGKYAEAVHIGEKALVLAEAQHGPDHPNVGIALSNLTAAYTDQGDLIAAETSATRALAITEKSKGKVHPDVGIRLNNLASVYKRQGRYSEAEPLHKRALAITELALGSSHPDVAIRLSNLAQIYQSQGRYVEAEPLFRRALSIAERALRSDDPNFGIALNNLAAVYVHLGRYAEALPLYERDLAISKRMLGAEHSNTAITLNNLAELALLQGRLVDAETLYNQALEIFEKRLGAEHPQVAIALRGLADVYANQDRPMQAEQLLQRSLAIREKAFGSEHPGVSAAQDSLALLALKRGDWLRAADYWRRSTGSIQRRAQRSMISLSERSQHSDNRSNRSHLVSLARTVHRLVAQDKVALNASATDMFETAQWAQVSEAAASLAQMSARTAKGDPRLAILARERQDLVAEWHGKDKQLLASKSEEPERRNKTAELIVADRLTAIDARLSDIDIQFAREFPEYATLSAASGMSVAELQNLLRAEEALIFFLDTPALSVLPEETFIWVVTKSEVHWIKSNLGTVALTREVTALRCGLDGSAWGDGTRQCAEALGISTDNPPNTNDPLPFDSHRSHKLYSALFDAVQDVLKDKKHLLIVPSGPLTKLPFQVLITSEPTSANYRAADWLTRQFALTVLPAVSSLKALRHVTKPSAAHKPMLGFGNPLLDGFDARSALLADLARDKQRCPEKPAALGSVRHDRYESAVRVERRGNLADASHIKRQIPLPETADELCAVAAYLRADVSDLRLGAYATEREVKRLSAAGELALYRIVHFATHGVLAGQIKGTHEAGLILTPPPIPSEEDDGYLSTSEIANLKLDADWVILSACNTAAGAETNSEALSGLARAFFYAQARALLVSHWEVNSDVTVKLITGALRELAQDIQVGRAEALKRSMLAIIDRGELYEAHPAYWAPFVVVGEGAPAE